MADIYDLIVIGGGPGGYLSARVAAKKGAKVALFEKDSLGGTCLNVGCIPTKYLLDKAKLMDRITELTEQGIFKEAGQFSFRKIQQGKEKAVSQLVGGVGSLLKASGVKLVKGSAQLMPGLRVSCNGREYQAKDIIIATGSSPVTVPVPGAENTIDSTAALALQKIPERLVVIGGGVIGMELASAYNAYGSDVTVVEMMERLYPAEEQKIVDGLVAAMTCKGVKIETGAAVKEVKKDRETLAVRYQKGEEEITLPADVVLMAAGRKANLEGIDANRLGIRLNSKGEIVVNQRMETSVPHIYAIGDVIGGYQLAHAAYAEGECAVHNIMDGPKTADLSVMPRCIYTIPCMAAVGITSAQARERGIDASVGTFHYRANGMALVEDAQGMVIVIADKKTKETLGVHILGEGATEMISFAAAAVINKMTLAQWEDLIVAHPSLSEMVREAALDCFGMAVHSGR
ncbi:dihydrolipoyl dehydrogenase [Christensenella hongkongensis]|uniref:Dihydrolipoyl dehydrogenase n=1 Tax=Christensenella hongkongensis TaxID=270498 RepID=A0A0M2NH97_9FIRM|nr:dihydrolipoyl dehydrogenase [Christensenella hongkongensis]KKI51939.1 Dihydrolipoamide dehydrogenase of acetoin dehydrogenase [Christensenella hongkongensis]TCW24536.1 dihydrolipoamide dehydrogenase [Christensenella hongkongensis]